MMATDVESAQNAMDSDAWVDLREKLFEYIDDFSYKIVPARSGFQF